MLGEAVIATFTAGGASDIRVTQTLPPTSGESTLGTLVFVQSEKSWRTRSTWFWFGTFGGGGICATATLVAATAARATPRVPHANSPRSCLVRRIASSWGRGCER